jgi:hypothetical protein
MLFAGISGFIFMNPLIKLDGYYVLMSWLDAPPARRSFEWVGRDFAHVHARHEQPPATRRERRPPSMAWPPRPTRSLSSPWSFATRAVFVGNFRGGRRHLPDHHAPAKRY